MESPQFLLVGQILRPHGVRGEVRMQVFTAYTDHLITLKTVYLAPESDTQSPKPFYITRARMHQDYVLLTFKGYADRDAVERLREQYVFVALKDAVPLDDDEVYVYAIIGLTVKLESGEVLGELVDVMETGANDVYVIQSPRYGEILIPAIDQFIVATHIETGEMTVRLLDGMLNETSTPKAD